MSLSAAFQKTRLVTLVSVTYMSAVLFVGAAPFFEWAYDDRYAKAAVYLPALVVGMWFSCLAGMYGAAFLVVGKSKWAALTSIAKLLVLAIGLPAVFLMGGDLLAVSLVVVVGDLVRAAVSQALGSRQGLLDLKADGSMFLLLASTCAGGYLLINHVPLVSGLHPLVKLILSGVVLTLVYAPLMVKFIWPLVNKNGRSAGPAPIHPPQTSSE